MEEINRPGTLSILYLFSRPTFIYPFKIWLKKAEIIIPCPYTEIGIPEAIMYIKEVNIKVLV